MKKRRTGILLSNWSIGLYVMVILGYFFLFAYNPYTRTLANREVQKQGTIDKRFPGQDIHPDHQKWKQCVNTSLVEVSKEYQTRPILILKQGGIFDLYQPSEKECFLPCLVVSEVKDTEVCAKEIDGIIFNPVANYTWGNREKLIYQKWGFYQDKPDLRYSLLPPDIQANIDVNITYSLGSDIPIIPFPVKHSWKQQQLQEGQNTFALAKRVLILLPQTCAYLNDNLKHIIQDLGAIVPVRVLGNCIEVRSADKIQTGRANLKQTLSQFDFVILIEEAIEKDYVSEDLFDIILAGATPIYYGAPNIHDFLPVANDLIPLQNFHGPQELAMFLLKVQSQRRTQLSWDKEEQKLIQLSYLSRYNAACRFCRIIKQYHDSHT